AAAPARHAGRRPVAVAWPVVAGIEIPQDEGARRVGTEGHAADECGMRLQRGPRRGGAEGHRDAADHQRPGGGRVLEGRQRQADVPEIGSTRTKRRCRRTSLPVRRGVLLPFSYNSETPPANGRRGRANAGEGNRRFWPNGDSMPIWEAILLGVVQGLTEFLPIS